MTTENQKNQNIIKSKELTSELKVNLLITKKSVSFMYIDNKQQEKIF